MLVQALFIIFIVISAIDVFHLGLYLIGANFYDYKQFKMNQKKRSRPRISPLVTVLIPAHNEELLITRCLESVRKSRHRKLEIIVVDDGSTDNSKRVVRKYISEHSNRNIRLMFKRSNVGKAEALNHALRHGARGDFVMTIDADSVIHPLAITNALKRFDDQSVVGVAANVRILDKMSILGVLQKFEYMVSYRSKKFYSSVNAEYLVGGVASTYRRSIMKKVGYYDSDTLTEDINLSMKIVSLGNRNHRVVYGSDVLAMTEPVGAFKTLLKQRYRWKMGSIQSLIKHRKMFASTNGKYSLALSWYRIPMAFLGELLLVLEPLAIAFVVYISFKLANPAFLIGAYSTITLYLLSTLWPDEHMRIAKKFKLTLMAPFMYFILYIMNVVQLVAVTRCLFNYKLVLRKVEHKSSWVSPDRENTAQVQFS